MDEVNGRVELILKRQRLSGPCNGSSGQRHAELLASLCNIIEVQALQIAQLRGEAPADLDLPKHLPEESGAAPEVQAPATSADPEQTPTRPPDEAACPPPAMPTGLKVAAPCGEPTRGPPRGGGGRLARRTVSPLPSHPALLTPPLLDAGAECRRIGERQAAGAGGQCGGEGVPLVRNHGDAKVAPRHDSVQRLRPARREEEGPGLHTKARSSNPLYGWGADRCRCSQGLGENQRLPTEAAAGPSTPLQGPVLPAVAPNTSLASAEYAFARPADFSCQSPPLGEQPPPHRHSGAWDSRLNTSICAQRESGLMRPTHPPHTHSHSLLSLPRCSYRCWHRCGAGGAGGNTPSNTPGHGHHVPDAALLCPAADHASARKLIDCTPHNCTHGAQPSGSLLGRAAGL